MQIERKYFLGFNGYAILTDKNLKQSSNKSTKPRNNSPEKIFFTQSPYCTAFFNKVFFNVNIFLKKLKNSAPLFVFSKIIFVLLQFYCSIFNLLQNRNESC